MTQACKIIPYTAAQFNQFLLNPIHETIYDDLEKPIDLNDNLLFNTYTKNRATYIT